jgi:cephalosporin-C deacetylase
MPLIDMPLDELREYTGTNPRPDDFDEYWDRALGELDGIDDEVELVEAEVRMPNVRCHHLYFTGVGGARIHAKLVRPAVDQSAPQTGRPAVLSFHGYSGDAGDWAWYLGSASAGFVCAALDCRGQGGESEDVGGVRGTTQTGHIVRGLDDGPDKLLFRQIFLDTAQLARIVMSMDEVDADRVGTSGGSQGGGLSLACAALVPQISRCAAQFPFLCDYQRVWEMDLAKNAYDDIRWFFRRFDPTHAREQEYFTRLGYIDVHNLATRIKADTVMLTGLMDEICPPSTQFAAYNAITAKKEMVIFPDFGHERLPGSDDLVLTHMLGL